MQINTHCYSIYVIIVYISNENQKTHLVEYAEYGYIQAISEWKKCLWPAQVAIAAHGHCLLLLNAIVQKKQVKIKCSLRCFHKMSWPSWILHQLFTVYFSVYVISIIMFRIDLSVYCYFFVLETNNQTFINTRTSVAWLQVNLQTSTS